MYEPPVGPVVTEAQLVYDDDCGFCTYWAIQIAAYSDVELVAFSDVDDDLEERLPEEWRASAHLVTDEAVYSDGASMEEAVLYTPLGRVLHPPIEWCRRFDAYVRFREWVYRWIADHRPLLSRIVSADPPERRQSA